MNKKIGISIAIIISMIFSFTVCFANDGGNMVQDAANGVRNVVGGAENAVEDAAKGVTDGAKNITNNIENVGNKAENKASNASNMTSSDNSRMSTNNSYTATRTSTGTEANTFMGMTATSWTWLIMGIAAIAIIALVWYYSAQMRSSNYDDHD